MQEEPLKLRRLLTQLSLAGLAVVVGLGTGSVLQSPADSAGPPTFQLITTFDVPGNVAEIAAVNNDGRTVVYTASTDQAVGILDISNPAAPVQTATIATPGEPTSTAIT